MIDRPSLKLPHTSPLSGLAASVERNFGRTAIRWHNGSYSYAEFWALTAHCAEGLRQRGIGPGDRVGLCLPNSPASLFLAYGAWRLGATLVPISSRLPARMISELLSATDASILVSESCQYGSSLPCPATTIQQIVGEQLAHRGLSGVETDGDSVASIPHSSGTTGVPKLPLLTSRSLAASFSLFISAYRLSASDVVPLVLPISHIYGSMVAHGTLLAGGTLVLTDGRWSAREFLEMSHSVGASIWFLAPPAIYDLRLELEAASVRLPSLRYVLSGGAPLNAPLGISVSRLIDAPVAQGYGLTECCSISHAPFVESLPVGEGLADALEVVGFPVSNTAVRVAIERRDSDSLQSAHEGEVLIRGPQVMTGYLGVQGKEQPIDSEGWLSTGDIGHVRDDGSLQITDRIKDFMKVRGYSLAPVQLEAELRALGLDGDFAVVGVSHPRDGERPVVAVPAESAAEWHSVSADLERWNGSLPAHMRIWRVIEIDALPRTESGKIMRRTVQAKLSDGRELFESDS